MEILISSIQGKSNNNVPLYSNVKSYRSRQKKDYASQPNNNLETLLETARRYEYHLGRITELQRLLSAEEAMIADCLAEESRLVKLLEKNDTESEEL